MWSERRLILTGLIGAVGCGLLILTPFLSAWVAEARLHFTLLLAIETLLFGLLGLSILFLLVGLRRYLKPK